MSAPALDILQHVLDIQSDGVMRDADGILDRTMILPYRRTFQNREVLIETQEDMIKDYSSFISAIRNLGVNHFIRLATSAEFLGDDHISGIYVSHMLQNATPMVESFKSRAVISKSDDGNWRFVEIHHNVNVSSFPVDMIRKPFQKVDVADAPADDPRRSGMDALDIYNRYLEATADTVAADDFAGYCDLMAFPYTAHGSDTDVTVDGPDGLRTFYNVLRSCHNGSVGDMIIRTADRAEFVGSDMICGYHAGTVYLKGKKTVDTVYSRIILIRQGTSWRLKSVSNTLENINVAFPMYEPGGELKTHLEILKRMKK